MTTLTINDAFKYFSNVKQPTTWKGQKFYPSACPICGGDDRAGFHEDEQGRVRWFCRHPENHPGCDAPGYWFLDTLIFLLTGERVDTGYVPDPSRPRSTERPKPPAPKFDDMLTSPVRTTLADVERWSTQHMDKAARYYGAYGISQTTLAKFKVGYAEKPAHCRLPAGYSIPNLSHGPNGQLALRGLQIRRADEVCRDILSARSPSWLRLEKASLFERWKKAVDEGNRPADRLREPSDDDLMDYLFPKYSSITGSSNGIWGDDLICLPGGEREGKNLPYILVNEDAKSGMVLRQAGWPAVAYKPNSSWDAHLTTVFKNCATVIIIGNNDIDWNNLDKGVIIARNVQEHVQAGGKRSRIIYPPKTYSDVADLVKAEGFDALNTWLTSKIPGIEPVLEAELSW